MSEFEWRIYRAHLRKMNAIFFVIGFGAGAFIGFMMCLMIVG